MGHQTITLQPGDTLTVLGGQGTTPPPVVTPPPIITPPPVITPPSGVHLYEFPWANSQNVPQGNIPKGDVLTLKTTTGPISSSNSLPFFAASEYQSGPRERLAVLSYSPGDFDSPIGGAPGATIRGKSITAKFAIGNGSGFGYYPIVPLNTDIYLNIKTVQDDDDQSREMFASLSINQL